MRGAWALGLTAAALAGCVAQGEIQNHVERINKSVGTSRNEAILLNIVRASRNEPLYFTSLPSITGQGNMSLSTGLPAITFGPGQTVAQKQYTFTNSLYNSAASTFDVGLLESKGFYDGLLRPINLPEANLILHQGFSRALVFSVLVDRVRITSGDTVEEIRNAPADPDEFRRFEEYLYLAVYYGLTVEVAAGPNGESEGRLCFDQALAGPEQKPFVRRSPIQCTHGPDGRTWAQRKPAELAFLIDGKPQSIEIILRSPNQIFQYLGSLVGPASAGRTVTLYGDGPGTSQGPLVVVTTDPRASCFARVTYDGVPYCVPDVGSDNTKRIFQILNQILALNTSPEDIPPTQSIFITQ